MARKPRALFPFDASYYRYPRSISRGFWGRYPLKTGLTDYHSERRSQWLAAASEWSKSEFHRMVSRTFVDSLDAELMQALLETHGVFAERWFHRSIHERVARRFAQVNIDLQDLQRLISSAWGHKSRIYRRSNAIFRVVDHIYVQTLIRAVSEPHVHHKLELWFDEFSTSRICALCGNKFRVIDLPDWIYFGLNGAKSCCFQCRILETPRKAELAELIPAFVESCGFIPSSDAGPITYAFTSRLSAIQWVDVFSAYAKMGGIDHVKKKFGSWFRALADTGALPDGVLITARGIRCLSADGHVCHSLAEQRIDNWLSAHELPHKREPRYPSHPAYNPTGRRRADWKIEDAFIEYFGLVGNDDYDKKMDEKILLAQHCKIDLIAIYPSDLQNLEQRLGRFLGR